MRRAIVRSLMGKNHNSTSDLKQKIKDILRQTNAKFSETDFNKNWRDFYVDESCPIVHRSGSKLVYVRTYSEYGKILSKVV
jgi:hypothetical protein